MSNKTKIYVSDHAVDRYIERIDELASRESAKGSIRSSVRSHLTEQKIKRPSAKTMDLLGTVSNVFSRDGIGYCCEWRRKRKLIVLTVITKEMKNDRAIQSNV